MRRAAPAGALALVLLAGCKEPTAPAPIAGDATQAPAFVGAPATPHPVEGRVPPHPFMAAPGRSTMHADAYGSNTHPGPGPLGFAPAVVTRRGSRAPGGECAGQVFDREDRLIVLCGNVLGSTLGLLDPRSLELLAQYPLPGRPSTLRALLTLDPDKIMSDTSGAYFYLDAQDRLVIADSRSQVRRIAHVREPDGTWRFVDEGRWDLSARVEAGCGLVERWAPWRGCDAVTAVMPDESGLVWWVTRRGRIGTLDLAGGRVQSVALPGEEIQNGFSVAADGVYIVSDHALYRYYAGADGAPLMGWREAYDRGSGRKSGSIDQGSGTTPALFGSRYVAITDNADGRVNLLVYRRDPGFAGRRQLCRVPLFAQGASSTDNSPVAYGRSVILENNFGYRSAFQQRDWSAVAGGIVRVDLRADESGCDVVWTSHERSPSFVPKLSAQSGLVYYYTFEPQAGGEVAWYLTALDFASGATVYKVRTGAGRAYDNNWAAMSLGPDGTAYIGVFRGLVAVRDSRPVAD